VNFGESAQQVALNKAKRTIVETDFIFNRPPPCLAGVLVLVILIYDQPAFFGEL